MEELLEAVFFCSLEREYEIGVRWSPASKDVSPEEDEHPPLETT
jgi:hypothetical protein